MMPYSKSIWATRPTRSPYIISDTLSQDEKADLIALIREYIDVFAWHYEDMLGLDPKVAMHRLNIKAGAKPVKQSQRRFRPDIMDAIEQEVRKLIDLWFIREEQHLIGSPTSYPSLKRMDQSVSTSTFETSAMHV